MGMVKVLETCIPAIRRSKTLVQLCEGWMCERDGDTTGLPAVADIYIYT